MRVKTKQRLVIVLVVFIVLAGAAVGLVAMRRAQIAEIDPLLREKGMAAAEQRDWPATLDHLSKYMARNKDDVQVLFTFADARRRIELPKGKHLGEAIGLLQRAHTVEPDNQKVNDLLLELYRMVGFNTETVELTDQMLEADPEHPEALWYRALALNQLRRPEEALDAALRHAQVSPLDLQGHMTVLQLMRQLNRTNTQLRDYVQRIRRDHPDDRRFELLQAHLHLAEGELAEARELLQGLADHEFDDPKVLGVLISHMDSAQMFDRSLEVLAAASKRLDDSEEAGALRRNYVRRFWEAGRPEAALAVMDDAIGDSASSVDLTIRGLCLLDLERYDALKPIIEQLDEMAENVDPLAERWARLLELSIQPDDRQRARLIDHCETVLNENANNPIFQKMLGEAYMAAGETELAISAFEKAIQLRRVWPMPYVSASQALMRIGQPPAALQVAVLAHRLAPDAQATRVNLAAARLATYRQNNADSADQVLEYLRELRADYPQDQELMSLEVALLGRMGRADEAARLLLEAINVQPAPSADVLMQYAQVSERFELGQEQAIAQRLEQTHGITPALAMMRIVPLLQAGDVEKAHRQFGESRDNAADPKDIGWAMTRARMLTLADDPSATGAWVKLADEHPENLQAQRTAAESPAFASQAFIERVVERIKQLTSLQGIQWRMLSARNQMRAEASVNDLSRAAGLLGDVITRAPHRVEPYLLRATCLRRLDDTEGALTQLEQAMNLRPNDPALVLDVARMHLERDDLATAQQTLSRFMGLKDRATADHRRIAAALMIQANQVDQAVALLTEGLDADQIAQSDDMLLAEAYRRARRYDLAEQIVRRRLADTADIASVQLLAQLLLAQGQSERAIEALTILDEVDAPAGVAELTRARFYHRLGRTDEAIGWYEKAQAVAPDSAMVWRGLVSTQLVRGLVGEALDSADKAITEQGVEDPVLRRLVDHRELISKFEQTNLLRPVVVSLVEQPRFADVAIELLGMLSRASDERADLADVVTDVTVLADKHPQYLALRLYIANMHALLGRFEEAAAMAARTADTFEESVPAVEQAARLAAAAGQFEQALALGSRWRERIQPQPLPADLFIAQIDLRFGRPSDAMKQLEPYMDQAKRNPDALPQVIQLAATGLIDLGRTGEARNLLQPLIKQDAAWRSMMMQLAGRRIDNAQAAADWLRQIEQAIPADQVAERVALADAWMLAGGRLSITDAASQSDRILEGLIADHPDSAQANLARAILFERRGELAPAEQYYRRTLELEPQSYVAMNNLAMVLSQDESRLDEAEQLALEVVEARPSVAAFHDTAAHIFKLQGNHAEAVTQLMQAMEAEPQEPEWQINLAEVLVLAGRVDQARELYEKLSYLTLEPQKLRKAWRDKLQWIDQQLQAASADPSAASGSAAPAGTMPVN